MKHSFTPKALSPTLCAACSRTVVDHGPFAQCEVCNNKGLCNIFMTILMCASCEQKEIELQTKSKNESEQRVEDTVKSYGDFFNARVTPIVALKELYELNGHTFAEFHERIKLQIEHFSRVLFEAQIVTTEDTISKLLIEFRAEVRTKLKEGDISYTPPIKAPKVQVRKSPLEKMAEMVVAAEGKKGNVITIVEAMRKLKSEMGLS